MDKWQKYATPIGQGSEFHACFCIGPQNGEPLCPCRMRNVRIRDGRYVEIIDHGPAKEKPPAEAEGKAQGG